MMALCKGSSIFYMICHFLKLNVTVSLLLSIFNDSTLNFPFIYY